MRSIRGRGWRNSRQACGASFSLQRRHSCRRTFERETRRRHECRRGKLKLAPQRGWRIEKSVMTRRELVEGIGAVALSPRVQGTPKIALGVGGADLNEAGMRRVKQIGVDHVLMGGPPIPWTEDAIRSLMDRTKQGGLMLGN